MPSPSLSLRTHTRDLEQRTLALKSQLKAMIQALPLNPDVKRLSKNCVLVSSNTLFSHNNWSPSFWINAEMEQRICEIIDKSRPENLRKNIVHILRSGSYELKYGQSMQINPYVLKAMRKAWLKD